MPGPRRMHERQPATADRQRSLDDPGRLFRASADLGTDHADSIGGHADPVGGQPLTVEDTSGAGQRRLQGLQARELRRTHRGEEQMV